METLLNRLSAFKAMVKFLEEFYRITHSDDIGSLLGDMSFLPDGSTADEGTWQDWLNAIEHKTLLSPTQAYEDMQKFLEYYAKNTSCKDILILIKSIREEHS